MKHKNLFFKSLAALLSLSWLAFSLKPAQATEGQASTFSTQDFTFANGDITLAGSLVFPEGDGPFPAVVMIHGSQPATRDLFYETGDAQVFLDAGFAVFIYDRRGTGGSGGDGQKASLEDLADDAIAAVELVKQQPGIKPDAVGTFGVSQGGTLGLLAATRSEEIDFVISVTATATPLANQEMWGASNELANRGFSEQSLNTAMKAFHLLYSARPLIQLGILPLDDLWFVAKDPYLDPADYWPQIKQPMFIAYGAQDPVVPTATSVDIAIPILQNGNSYSRLYVYAGARHGVRTETGRWANGHIQAMTTWALDVANGKAPAPQPEISASQIDPGPNRWYDTGPDSTPWYATANFQLPLILFFLLTFAATAVISLLPWVKFNGVWPRLAMALTGVLNLGLLVGLLVVLNFLLNADAEGFLPPVPLGGWLFPLAWVSVVLAFWLTYVLRVTEVGQGVFGFVTLVAWGFVLFLGYWGVLWGRL